MKNKNDNKRNLIRHVQLCNSQKFAIHRKIVQEFVRGCVRADDVDIFYGEKKLQLLPASIHYTLWPLIRN